MDAVIAQKVGVGFNWACRVDLDDLDVVACALGDMREGATADAAESVDAYCNCHVAFPMPVGEYLVAFGIRVGIEQDQGNIAVRSIC